MNTKLEKALLKIAKKLRASAVRMKPLEAMTEEDNARYCEWLAEGVAKDLGTPQQHETARVVARSYGYNF